MQKRHLGFSEFLLILQSTMPYQSNKDLPANVTNALASEPHAQDIYREAFNSAWDQYASPSKRQGSASREETSHKVAWAAVEKKYKKNSQGKWVKH
jgi:cation transport regulator